MSIPILYASLLALLLYLLLNRFQQRLSRRSRLPLPPGPKPWPVLGNLPHLGAVPHHSLAALARTYGPLMYLRLGCVDVVVASSSTVAEQFLKKHDANFSNRPSGSGSKHMAYNGQDLVFAPYGPRWRWLRKITFVHLFSTKALDELSHIRQEEVAELTRTLESAGESSVRLGQLLNLCTANALGRMMTGKGLFGSDGSRGDVKADDFKEMVVQLMMLAGAFNIGNFIPALDWLDLQGVNARMKKLHTRLDTFIGTIVEEHRRGGAGGDGGGRRKMEDLLSTLISLEAGDGKAEGGKITDTEIKALLTDLLTAGSDTSSSTVEWAIVELIRHPKIMAQAQQELDTVVGRDRLVLESDLPRLHYLQAVIKEVFRLHPSTPLSLPRIAAEDCDVNGYRIPKNTTLLVNVWAISRNPDTWAEPLVFRPGRFLPGGERPNADVKGTDFEVMPFGSGRRICAGMRLGVRSVQVMTATLVHAFDWGLPGGQAPDELNMEEAFGLSLQRAAPLEVVPRPRLPSHVYRSAAVAVGGEF